jgi:hypothetical protein
VYGWSCSKLTFPLLTPLGSFGRRFVVCWFSHCAVSFVRPSVRPTSLFRRKKKGKGRERKSEQARRARVALRWVGLHAKENRQPARMSGSEQAQSSVKVETESAPQPVASSSSSCRKKKSESTTFFGDVLDHIDEFVHASMEEHKSCLKKTLNKVMSAVCLFVCVCVCVCVCVSCNFRDCNFLHAKGREREGSYCDFCKRFYHRFFFVVLLSFSSFFSFPDF